MEASIRIGLTRNRCRTRVVGTTVDRFNAIRPCWPSSNDLSTLSCRRPTHAYTNTTTPSFIVFQWSRLILPSSVVWCAPTCCCINSRPSTHSLAISFIRARWCHLATIVPLPVWLSDQSTRSILGYWPPISFQLSSSLSSSSIVNYNQQQ